MRDDTPDLGDVPVIGSLVTAPRRLKRQMTGHVRLPAALYVTQVFLFLVIAVYFTKLAAINIGLAMDYGRVYTSMLTYFVDVLMLIVSVDAIIGVSSKRPAAWRKVMRGAALLLIFSIIGAVTNSTGSISAMVNLSPTVVAVICLPVIALMFTRTVREHYALPQMEVPPLSRWVRYVLFTPLYPARRYEIDYGAN